MTTPTRPVLRYHGGKWRLAPWIISHFPEHRCYVEPFGGGASVLLRKDRSYSEVYNDLSADVVNLFRVLRSDDAQRLIEAVQLTPFSRDEFAETYQETDEPIEKARRLVARSAMGFGSGLAVNRQSTGFRADSKKSGTTPARDWMGYPSALLQVVDRMRGVIVENKPAVDVIQKHDGAETLFYVDPPYVHDTRSSKRSSETLHHRYAHEMTDDEHAEMLAVLTNVKGKVVLSGYPHPIYEGALSDWHRVTCEALADGARKRTEVLWMNFNPSDQLSLLDHMGAA
jgi:DNA adenine methylase